MILSHLGFRWLYRVHTQSCVGNTLVPNTAQSRARVGGDMVSNASCGAVQSEPWLLGQYGGFHSHGGKPIAGWFISMGKSQSKMDDFGVPHGATILGNLHIYSYNESDSTWLEFLRVAAPSIPSIPSIPIPASAAANVCHLGTRTDVKEVGHLLLIELLVAIPGHSISQLAAQLREKA